MSKPWLYVGLGLLASLPGLWLVERVLKRWNRRLFERSKLQLRRQELQRSTNKGGDHATF